MYMLRINKSTTPEEGEDSFTNKWIPLKCTP
jgi:hypothetical protein